MVPHWLQVLRGVAVLDADAVSRIRLPVGRNSDQLMRMNYRLENCPELKTLKTTRFDLLYY